MKYLKFLLFPLSLIFWAITSVRNWLFDHNILKSFSLEVNTIAVGNLTVGGTGKTPLIEYLINLLKGQYSIATLSRGYGRKTRGFMLAQPGDTAFKIGDEPAQFLSKFKNEITVAVGEDRLYAVPHILESRPSTDLILLDDAYQHRSIKPGCNILLSDYNRPFYRDWLLPAGNLRESRRNARRADIVIVTKCPRDLKDDQSGHIAAEIRTYTKRETPVFFMHTHYPAPEPAFGQQHEFNANIILVTGIAQPQPLVDHLLGQYTILKHFKFADHHFFTRREISVIVDYYKKNQSKEPSILLTEKDIARLSGSGNSDILMGYPVFFQPITYKFAEDGLEFEDLVRRFLEKK